MMRGGNAFALILMCSFCGTAEAAISYIPVALSGQTPVGLPGDKFTRFSDASLNDLGQVAFSAALSSMPSNAPDGGVWIGSAHKLTLVARRGDAAAGLLGVAYGVLDPPSMFSTGLVGINNAGQVAFGGYLNGSSVTSETNTALWIGKPGALSLLARQGSIAPDSVFKKFGPLNQVLLNERGDVAFQQFATGAPDQKIQAIWAGNQNSLHLVARIGATAPGTNLPYTVLNPFVLNDQGQVAFGGFIAGSGLDGNNEGIWGGYPDAIQLVAKVQESAPGTGGQVFQSLDRVTMNKAGSVAFRAWVDPPIRGNSKGLWAGTIGNVHPILRDGDPAPGTGREFDAFNWPVANTDGKIAVSAALRGLYDGWGIWAGQPNHLKLLAFDGAPATGLPPTFQFVETNYGIHKINEQGQVAFLAGFAPINDAAHERFGIWAADSIGDISPIFYDGQLLDVAPGDLRTVRFAYPKDFDLNEAGQISFTVDFTDGSSGVFLATVPEPQCLLIASLLVLKVRSRRII